MFDKTIPQNTTSLVIPSFLAKNFAAMDEARLELIKQIATAYLKALGLPTELIAPLDQPQLVSKFILLACLIDLEMSSKLGKFLAGQPELVPSNRVDIYRTVARESYALVEIFSQHVIQPINSRPTQLARLFVRILAGKEHLMDPEHFLRELFGYTSQDLRQRFISAYETGVPQLEC